MYPSGEEPMDFMRFLILFIHFEDNLNSFELLCRLNHFVAANHLLMVCTGEPHPPVMSLQSPVY